MKDRESGTAKLSCRNWECGVLVAVGKPAGTADSSTWRGADQGAQAQAQAQMETQMQTHKGRDGEQLQSEQKQEGKASSKEESLPQRRRRRPDGKDEAAGLNEAFGTTMPVPMKIPAGRYTSDESTAGRPWFFMKAD